MESDDRGVVAGTLSRARTEAVSYPRTQAQPPGALYATEGAQPLPRPPAATENHKMFAEGAEVLTWINLAEFQAGRLHAFEASCRYQLPFQSGCFREPFRLMLQRVVDV